MELHAGRSRIEPFTQTCDVLIGCVVAFEQPLAKTLIGNIVVAAAASVLSDILDPLPDVGITR